MKLIKGGASPSNTTVVFDGPPPPFIVRTLRDGTLRDGTPQVQMKFMLAFRIC